MIEQLDERRAQYAACSTVHAHTCRARIQQHIGTNVVGGKVHQQYLESSSSNVTRSCFENASKVRLSQIGGLESEHELPLCHSPAPGRRAWR